MCFKSFPLAAEHFASGNQEEPESWRDQFFVCSRNDMQLQHRLFGAQTLREEEARKFQELGSRLRDRRKEAEDSKKEREVKLTDRIPLNPKRSRTGCKLLAYPFLNKKNQQTFYHRGNKCTSQDSFPEDQVIGIENSANCVHPSNDANDATSQRLSSKWTKH